MEVVKSNVKSVTKVIPVGARILVKAAEVNDKTAGGIFTPGSHYVKPTAGTVILVGTASVDKAINCKIGDNILFNMGAGTEVVHMGEKHILMWAMDQIAVVTEEIPA